MTTARDAASSPDDRAHSIFAFDTEAIARYEHALLRGSVAPLIWTPCFPCVLSWLFSSAVESAIEQKASGRRAVLMRGGLQIHVGAHRTGWLLESEQAANMLSIPFDRILSCRVISESARPCCSAEPRVTILTVVIQCSSGDGDGQLPSHVHLRGLRDPHSFLTDLLAKQQALPSSTQGDSPESGGGSKNTSAMRWLQNRLGPGPPARRPRANQIEVRDTAYREMML